MDIATQIAPDKYGTPVQLKPQYDNFINGRWQAPVDGRYFDKVTPVTGALLARVAQSKRTSNWRWTPRTPPRRSGARPRWPSARAS